MGEWPFLEVLRDIAFWTSPLVFLVGVTMLLQSEYKNFEALMAKEYGLRKKILPKLEKNIYSFHEWCLKKHILLGSACIIYALVVFLVLKKIPTPIEV